MAIFRSYVCLPEDIPIVGKPPKQKPPICAPTSGRGQSSAASRSCGGRPHVTGKVEDVPKGKPCENHGKTVGKPWESPGKTIGKPWENHRKMMVEWDFMGIYPLVSSNMAMENPL